MKADFVAAFLLSISTLIHAGGLIDSTHPPFKLQGTGDILGYRVTAANSPAD